MKVRVVTEYVAHGEAVVEMPDEELPAFAVDSPQWALDHHDEFEWSRSAPIYTTVERER